MFYEWCPYKRLQPQKLSQASTVHIMLIQTCSIAEIFSITIVGVMRLRHA